jgi:hypothetical protein
MKHLHAARLTGRKATRFATTGCSDQRQHRGQPFKQTTSDTILGRQRNSAAVQLTHLGVQVVECDGILLDQTFGDIWRQEDVSKPASYGGVFVQQPHLANLLADLEIK